VRVPRAVSLRRPARRVRSMRPSRRATSRRVCAHATRGAPARPSREGDGDDPDPHDLVVARDRWRVAG
jgi:hypothetical protein